MTQSLEESLCQRAIPVNTGHLIVFLLRGQWYHSPRWPGSAASTAPVPVPCTHSCYQMLEGEGLTAPPTCPPLPPPPSSAFAPITLFKHRSCSQLQCVPSAFSQTVLQIKDSGKRVSKNRRSQKSSSLTHRAHVCPGIRSSSLPLISFCLICLCQGGIVLMNSTRATQ